jgi:hypothetical protein
MTSDPAQRPIDPDPQTQDKSVRSETVETVHGEVTVAQQPTGDLNEVGGGEFPDPETTPSLHDPDSDPTEDGEEVIADGSGSIGDGPRRRPHAE